MRPPPPATIITKHKAPVMWYGLCYGASVKLCYVELMILMIMHHFFQLNQGIDMFGISDISGSDKILHEVIE